MQGQAFFPFSGNVASDPELRYSPKGVAVCRLTVMDKPRYLDREAGKWVDGESTPYQVVCFNDMAEHVAESCQKGARVMVTGTMAREKYTTPDGEDRYAWKVTAEDIGLSLRWTSAKVVKTERRGQQPTTGTEDPWRTAEPSH